MRTILVSDLTEEHVGTPIQYDGDGPTIYGGQRPRRPDGDPDLLIVTLDGREIEGYAFDEVWLP